MTEEAADPLGPLTFADHVARCFAEAQTVWGIAIDLSPPQRWRAAEGAEPDAARDPLAYIDLTTRQIVVNFDQLYEIGALASLTAVLAHEIGHHIRFPHTLGLAAALEVLQRRLVDHPESLTNLFFDLQVNEWVGRERAAELQTVYRGFLRQSSSPPSDLFAFYLMIYEELWGLVPGDLAGEARIASLEGSFPGAAADARMFAQTFWSLPDSYVQFVYFIAIFARYLPANGGAGEPFPMTRDAPTPDADDYAGSLYGSARSDRAVEEARKRGWIGGPANTGAGETVVVGKSGSRDPMAVIRGLVAGRPGTEMAPFRRLLVSKHYQRLVDRHLIEIPTLPDVRAPDLSVPSTTEDWEWGESPTAIDWTASVLAHGALAAALPLKRTLLPTDPDPRGVGVPNFEIYLDTSGSMPNPEIAENPMTVAAQVLSAAAIRKGARVRAVVYSMGDPLVSDWMYDEAYARQFLLNYAGGGTDYPFGELASSCAKTPDAVRVIVSDSDFIYNCTNNGGLDALVAGIKRSRRLVALLAIPAYYREQCDTVFAPAIACPNFRLVRVDGTGDLAKAAADLSRALF